MNFFNNIQYDFTGDMLTNGAEYTGKYNLPMLKQQRNIPPAISLPVNYMMSDKNISKHWFHCFVDDRHFERFWDNFYKYKPYIKKAAGFISTDFSIYRNMDEDLQRRNCYRNRVMAYAMQAVNPNIIPTAGFGGENTWQWCFEGLPHHSTLAITTNGTLTDPEARRLFIGGVDALVKVTKPYALVVCGNYPQWLNSKYPGIKIAPILNFSQFRRLRGCA